MYHLCGFMMLILALILYLKHWIVSRRLRKLAAVFPGWRTVPLLGNALDLIGGPRVIFQRLLEIGETAEKKNSMFKLWFGPQLVLVGHKPDDIKALTNAFIEKPYYYRFGREWLGDGLVTGPSSKWKRNVKNVAASFSGSVIDGFQDIYNHQAAKLVDNLRKEAGMEPFDAMKKYLAYATLETICQTAMGVADIAESIITSEYYEAFNRTLELIIARGFNILLHPQWIYRLTPGYRELKKNIAVLHNVSKTVISQKRSERDEIIIKGQTKQTADAKNNKLRPFLDIMMELSETDPLLTDDQIRAEVDTVIVGGQETTATTMLFSLLMLGCHQGVQDTLYQEIKKIFGDSKRPITKEDLSELKYCEAVICESLRLFPPIPAVMRYADTEMNLDGYTVPAGTVCVINALGAGRSQQNWGLDAEQYRPERWLVNPPSNPAVFLSFSYGRRACIGKRYAITALKTMLAYCVRELEFFSEAHKMELSFGIALRPHSNYLMQVKLRC